MREIATIFGGIGLLIFAYLLINNAGNTKTVISSASSALTSTISVLQGNGGGSAPGGINLNPIQVA